jgi:hypothetical protein
MAVHDDALSLLERDGLLIHHEVERAEIAVRDHRVGIDVLRYGWVLARVEGHQMPCVTEAALVFEEEQLPSVVIDAWVSFGDVFEHLLFAMGI